MSKESLNNVGINLPTEEEMPKIMWVSNNSHLPTGYGRMTRHITNYLSGQHNKINNPSPYNVKILGLQQTHAPMRLGNIDVLPRFRDEWASEAMPFWAKQLQPDIITTLMDVWVSDVLKDLGKEFSYCPYIPIDSLGLPPRMEKPLRNATKLIAMSDFGEEVLRDFGYDERIVKIPHGVDTEIYRPKRGGHKYTKEQFDIDDKFVYLHLGTNIGRRKRIPRLMRAFKKVNDEYSDTFLWIHCDPTNERGQNLNLIADMIDIDEDSLMFTPGLQVGLPIGIDELVELYNMGDVFVSATEGEGFGLGHVESMACGKPNVTTNFSTAKEFIGDNKRGYRADVATLWTTPVGHQRAFVDIDDLAYGMRLYYEDSTRLKKDGKRARNFAKQYDWKKVFPMWDDMIEEVMENKLEGDIIDF